MAKQSKKQSRIVERVMHEFKDGDLETSAGDKVKTRQQAVAIALSEAGESNRVTPAQNRKHLRHTESRGRDPTKHALYEEAKRKKIPGRSTMTKAELAKALDR